MSSNNILPDITLDELERLIRILGMLGSVADGEVLAAAKFAQKWVVEHQTDWRTLLTPPEEPLPVTGVGPPVDLDALERAAEIERVQAFQNGYQAGVKAATAAIKAGMAQQAAQSPGVIQQGIGGHPAAQGSTWVWPGQNIPPGGLGGGLGGSGGHPAAQARPAPQGAQQASQAAPQAPGWTGANNPYPPGSWKAVAWELLDRDRQGIPGVFRGPPGASKEQQFVADVLRRSFATLTAAQDTWLRDIAGRNGLSW